MEKRQVDVGQLQFGMYVAEIDRPWTDTPFMYQGFVLRTEQQLAALKKFCKHVFVDPEKAERADPRPPAAQFRIRGSTPYPEKASVEAEFRSAMNAYGKSVHSVGELLQPLRPESPLSCPWRKRCPRKKLDESSGRRTKR